MTTYKIACGAVACAMSVGHAAPTMAQDELHAASFVDVSNQMGISPYTGETLSTIWFDFDRDGKLDLWLGNHIGVNDPQLLIGDGQGSFNDITSQVWSANRYRDTHGSSWADFDRDGDPDLLEGVGAIRGTATGRNYFFVNDNGVLEDEAEARGVDNIFGQSRTPVWYDWDNDGTLDLILATRFRKDLNLPSILYHQQGGIFVDVSEDAGFFPDRHAVFAVLADLSGDRSSDLILHGYDFPHRIYDGATNPFIDLAPALFPGLEIDYVHDIAIGDLNGDNRNDLVAVRWGFPSQFVTANDTMFVTRLVPRDSEIRFRTAGRVLLQSPTTERISAGWNFHIGDEGYGLPGDPTLVVLDPSDTTTHGFPTTDIGILIGYDPATTEWRIGQGRSPSGFGSFLAVITSSGPITGFSVSGGPPRLFQNALWMYDEGEGSFVDNTVSGGFGSMASCTSVVAADLDNDTDLDLVLACAEPFQMLETKVLRNDGTGHFSEVPASAGAQRDTVGRGYEIMSTPGRVAVADFNRDGFLDLLFPSMTPITTDRLPLPEFPQIATQLFENQGNGNHWIEVELVGSISNLEAIGTRVEIVTGGLRQFREKGREVHRYVQDDPILHFGLGLATTVDSLFVNWPSGHIELLTDVAADQVIHVTENETPLPVEVVELSASLDDRDVILQWRAILAPDVESLEVVRVVDESEVRVGEVAPGERTHVATTYHFRVQGLSGGDFSFRVRVHHTDGTITRSRTVSISLPVSVSAIEVYPMPIASSTTIKLEVPDAQNMDIALYNLIGQRVLDVFSGTTVAGSTKFTFSTSSLAAGVYVLRATGSNMEVAETVVIAP